MEPFTVGPVGHFSLAVRDPRAHAAWFTRCLRLEPFMDPDDESASVGNDSVTIWFHRGEPSPETVGHISFQLGDRAELERALAHLEREGVALEDPGHEIGPMAPGQDDYLGLWFHDPDGYRWELSAHVVK
ncbi:MAG TPA: VOC family protein [Candidatus Baltobacteraceae bacterium]|nr:VOC family protein [Candidatus Baltobacteraceae bacterium]